MHIHTGVPTQAQACTQLYTHCPVNTQSELVFRGPLFCKVLCVHMHMCMLTHVCSSVYAYVYVLAGDGVPWWSSDSLSMKCAFQLWGWALGSPLLLRCMLWVFRNPAWHDLRDWLVSHCQEWEPASLPTDCILPPKDHSYQWALHLHEAAEGYRASLKHHIRYA